MPPAGATVEQTNLPEIDGIELMREVPRSQRTVSGWRSWLSALREFSYGFTGYEFARHAIESRAALENVFLMTLVGDMLGVPVIPPYYSLRLLPFVVPEIATWKRRVLRPREFTDEHEYHLHGV